MEKIISRNSAVPSIKVEQVFTNNENGQHRLRLKLFKEKERLSEDNNRTSENLYLSNIPPKPAGTQE